MSLSTFVSALVMALALGNTSVAQSDWAVLEERNGISLFEKNPQPDSLRHFKAEFSIPAGIKSCIDNLYHAELHVLFMDGMKSSELIRKEHDKSLIFYQVLDLPWPIPNRDMVTHAVFEHTPEARTVTVTLSSVPGEKAPTHMSRVNVPDRVWTFVEHEPGITFVTYFYSSNPSAIPYLLENTISIDGPLDMMDEFRKLAVSRTEIASRITWLD